MEALSKIFPFLFRLFIPKVAEGVADIFGAYRTYVIQLPMETDGNEFRQYILNQLIKVPRWSLLNLDYFKGKEIWIPAGDHKINPKDSFLAFYAEREGILDTNFARIIKIVFQENSESKLLIICSHFESSQPIERGKLTAVNDIVLGVVKNYYLTKNYDISKNFVTMEKYNDIASQNDKKISPYFAGTIISIVLIIVIIIFLNLASITKLFI